MRLLTFSFLKCCKYKRFYIAARMFSSDAVKSVVQNHKITGDPSLVEILPSWTETEEPELRTAVLEDMQVFPDFVTEQEEATLLAEIEPYLKRMRYEFDHWDNAIQGFRETERSRWSPENDAVFARVRQLAFPTEETLPHVHVLDLAAAGHIKPHVDAVRFCGDVIAGLCLSSSAVMRLRHSDNPNIALQALLAQRALYIMRGRARYDFSHEVLGGEDSLWKGQRVPRRRRVALICRSPPTTHT